MSETKGPLDEIQWSDADAVAFYKGITADNIHLYFLSSPFCDPTSNNKLLEAQSRFSEAMHPILMSRELFEQRLKTMPGIEYLVVDGPRPGEQTVNPVWVIRKQRRTKIRGSSVDREETLGTYWAVGPNVYQAPKFGDVLNCRLVRLSTFKL
jgi:mediator of RNA polymerase II transcription subunit 6